MAGTAHTETELDRAYLDLLVRGSDAVVAGLKTEFAAGVPADLPHRVTMRAVLSVLTVMASRTSRWYADASVLPLIDTLLGHLEASQGANGLFDGDNLSSPPDTSFTINDLCTAVEIIAGQAGVPGPVAAVLPKTAVRLQAIAAAALPALLAGGVHTPNHRWEIASALARIDELWPDARIAGRVDDWLREGVDIDADGFYSEQSPNYAAYVSNPSLLTLARLTARPELLDPVRHLAEVLVEPMLARTLPPAAPQAAVDEAFYSWVGPARRRNGRDTLTVFGGGDFARTRRIASGLANSAVFLRMRHGDAILDAMRVSPQFFDLGAFRAGSIEQHNDGDGFVLRERRASGYYQPLAAAELSRTGEYDLGDEGRFFGSMSFPRRDLSPIVLDTTVSVDEVAGGVDVSMAFDGVSTGYAIELVFRPGGVLEGVTALPGTDAAVFADGTARYSVGDDVIEFRAAPGSVLLPGRRPRFDEGEMFGYVGGNDRIPGLRVLIAGRTDAPFTLELRTGTAAGPV